MLKLDVHVFNPFQENTWVISHSSGNCLVVDPGCSNTHEQQHLLQFLDKNQLIPNEVWLTHAHIDHVLGVDWLCRTYQIPMRASQKSIPLIESLPDICRMYGLPPVHCPKPDFFFDHQAGQQWLGEHFEVPHLPGHSPDHVALIHGVQGFMVSGDLLFYNSIGRSDLPGGDHETLMKSIRKGLFSYPDDMQVYPGHGPSTTIGRERKINPFVGQSSQNAFS